MDWIALISSVAALVTAAAAFLTVLEMKRQRVTLYRPDLAVPSAELFAYVGSYSEIGNSVHCSTKRYDLPGEPPTSLPVLELGCFNVGLGAAKDVEIYWRFDADAVVKALNRLATPHGIAVTFGEYGFTLVDGAGNVLHRGRRASSTQRLPYLLPVQMQPDAQRIPLPWEYAQAVAICASYYVEPHDEKWASIPPASRPALHVFPEMDGAITVVLPPVTLSLRYRDIGDNTHVREFEITPTFSHIQQLPQQPEHIQEIGEGQLRVVPIGTLTKLLANRSTRRASRFFQEVELPDATHE